MCGDRRELRARREQRREVKDQVHLELGQDALEQRAVGDRAGELAKDEPVQRRIERREIDGDNRAAGAGQPGDQAVADLAAGAGHQGDGSTHEENNSRLRAPSADRVDRSPPSDAYCLLRADEQPFDLLADPGQVLQRTFGFRDRGQQVAATRRAAPGDLGRQVAGRRGARFTDRDGLSVRLQELEKLLLVPDGSPSLPCYLRRVSVQQIAQPAEDRASFATAAARCRCGLVDAIGHPAERQRLQPDAARPGRARRRTVPHRRTAPS